MMLSKGSPLTSRINDVITTLKQDGSIAKLYVKWFGVDAPAGSSSVTVVPLPHAG